MGTLFNNSFLDKVFDIKSLIFSLICFLGLSVIFQGYSQAQVEKVAPSEEKVSSDVKLEEAVPVDEVDVSVPRAADLSGDGAPAPVLDPFEIVGKSDQASEIARFIPYTGMISGSAVGAVKGSEFGGAITTINDKIMAQSNLVQLVVGAFNDDDADGGNPGAVYVIIIDYALNILHFQKITSNEGGFKGAISNKASFGHSVINARDLNGDGWDDILVGAPGDDVNENPVTKDAAALDATSNGPRPGSFYILFLNEKGQVIDQQKIGGKNDGFPEIFRDGDELGHTVGFIPRRNGVNWHSTGVPGDDDGGQDAGSAYVLELQTGTKNKGKVIAFQKISSKIIGSKRIAKAGDRFGDAGTSSIGDLDGDGNPDIAVGASGADIGGGDNEGKFWIVNLLANASVKAFKEISEATQKIIAINAQTSVGDFFGHGIFRAGALNGNTIVGVGAFGADSFGIPLKDTGALYILQLNNAGDVTGILKLSNDLIGFPFNLVANEWFGFAAARVLSINKFTVIAVGAPGNVGDPPGPGKVYFLLLNSNFQP